MRKRRYLPRAGRALPAALAGLLLLGGCTVVQALSPAPPGLPLAPLRAPDTSFTLRDGTVLPARLWRPAGPPCGVILALHGFADSRDGWAEPAPFFTRAGYLLVAPDQRGFGGTATRGHWAGAARMVDDAAELVAQLRASHPGTPVIVMGESMGGAVALLLAAGPNPPQDATVLLAPAVWSRAELDPAVTATLWLAVHVAPGWAPGQGQLGRDIFPSDNIPALLALGRDPLTLRRQSIAMLNGLATLMDDAQRAAPDLHGRVLMLSGRRDQLVPGIPTEASWARAPASVRRGFYPDGYHLLPVDRDRALVAADILSWLRTPDAWLPSGADIAAGAWLADHAWQDGPPALTPAAHADDTGAAAVWPY